MKKKRSGVLWMDRRRVGPGLPLSFTRYILTAERLDVYWGISRNRSAVMLYNVNDVDLHRTVFQFLCNTGDVILLGKDITNPVFTIQNIKYPDRLYNMLFQLVEAAKGKIRDVTVHSGADDKTAPEDPRDSAFRRIDWGHGWKKR